jgi:hypothetical protein
MDLHNHMMEEAKRKKEIRGLVIEEHNLSLCQDYYADNTTLLVEADRKVVDHCIQVAEDFGKVSGLFCQWTGMHAVFVGSGPVLREFVDLGWIWESQANFTKLLGIQFRDGIDPYMMVSQVNSILDKRLAKSKMDPTSQVARLVIIKQLFQSLL